jgi:hypothetical protein
MRNQAEVRLSRQEKERQEREVRLRERQAG